MSRRECMCASGENPRALKQRLHAADAGLVVPRIQVTLVHGGSLGCESLMGGKTTLIQMSCGLQKPSAGGAVVTGMDIRQGREKLRGHNWLYVAAIFTS